LFDVRPARGPFASRDEERPVIESLPSHLGPLLEAARAGSPEALGKLFEALRPYLYVLARRRGRRKVRAKVGESDLVQDTLTVAYRDFPDFRGQSADQFLCWLQGILRHQSLNELRYFKRVKRDVGRECPLKGPHAHRAGEPVDVRNESPSDLVIRKEAREAARRALLRLPEKYRRVLEMYYGEGKGLEAIASQLGLSIGAVRKRWVRGLPLWRAEMVALESLPGGGDDRAG
jgi:RNA polymerase sigma-70 factor (ECF subfamily)